MRWLRLWCVLLLVDSMSTVFLRAAGLPQAPPTPAGEYTRRILDLKYTVLDLAGGSSATSAASEKISGQIQDLAVTETATEMRLELAADVLFDFDKAVIKTQAAETLKKVATILRDKARGPVRVDGYTDAKGSDAYNRRLSLERARAVTAWLQNREGLRTVSFVPRGSGAANPVAPNTNRDGSDNPAGRQKNRRVEIVAGKG